MDWKWLKTAVDAWYEDGTNDFVPGVMEDLLDFIPADPNKAADAEWLAERGWTPLCTKGLMSECGCLVFDRDDWLFFKGKMVKINPSRMTVALFEAAAREGMVK